MSIHVMSVVWSSKKYSGGTLLVLLAMADYADDKDWTCRPSVASLAKKTRLSERQVQRILREMERDGVITAAGDYPSRRGSPIVIYRINANAMTKDVPVSPLPGTRVTSTPRRGDICNVKRVTPMSYDPSLDPSTDPSVKQEKGEAAPPPAFLEPVAPIVDAVWEPQATTAKSAPAMAAPVQSPFQTVAEALDGASPASEPDPTTAKTLTQQPAIVIYHEVFLSFPPKRIMVQILKHGVEDLPRWSAAVTAWCQHGYNPLNIAGMLDWYDHPDRMAPAMRPATRCGSRNEPVSKVEMSMRAFDEFEAIQERQARS